MTAPRLWRRPLVVLPWALLALLAFAELGGLVWLVRTWRAWVAGGS